MSDQTSELEMTGERMVPRAAHPKTFWEHVDRYRFACPLVRGCDVLDIACGEGYGAAALLGAGARSLVGVDISAQAVEHARRTYGIDARTGSAEAIPLPDGAVDCVVSFETIEHVPHPEAFVRECARVLRPGGSLVMSTPNLQQYRADTENPFHCSELSLEDFRALIGAHFAGAEYFGQAGPLPRWTGRRGGGKLLRLGQRLFNPDYLAPLTEEKRRDVVRLCQQQLSGLSQGLTPTSVRAMPPAGLARAMYIVVRASGPRQPS